MEVTTVQHPNSPGPLNMGLPWDFPQPGELYQPRVKQCPQTHPHDRHGWSDDQPYQSRKNPQWHFYRKWNCEGIVDQILVRVKYARQLAVELEGLMMARRHFGNKARRGSNLYQHLGDRMKEVQEEMNMLAMSSGQQPPVVEADDDILKDF